MNKEFTLKMVIQAIDQVTAPVRKMGQAFAGITRRANLERLSAALGRIREKLGTVAGGAAPPRPPPRDMGGSAIARITAPLGLLGGFALKAAADMETLEVSFQSMLGGADAAKAMVKSLADFSAKTPFQLAGIGAAAKQLLSFGVAQGDVMGSLKFLGDIAAGANVPLENMASIFGKAKAKGKAMTEELLQLSDQGVPIIDVLAKKLGRSKSEIFELASAGRISFKTFADALQSMSEEGGIFFDQMNKQSGTLGGLFSTLRDNVIIALGEIGKQMVETFDLKAVMDVVIEFIGSVTEGFKAFAQEHPGLTKIVFVIAALAAAAGPALLAIGALATVFGVMATGLGLVMSPLGLVLILLAALAAGAAWVYANWEEVAEFFTDIWEKVAGAFRDGVAMVTGFLDSIDLSAIGARWVGGLADGIAQRWSDLTAWLGQAVAELTNWLPDWVKEKLGMGGAGLPSQRDGGAAGMSAQPVASALSPRQNQVGGAIKVDFANAPPNMRIRDVKSDTPGFGIDVDAGYAMAGP